MKIFVLAPQEGWICDRLVSEWYDFYPKHSTKNILEADIVWLLAGWCWNHIPVEILKSKKIVVTEHHIVPEKFSQQKYQNFLLRDQFVDLYHVPNEKTKNMVQQLTNKRIEVVPYWLNSKLWKPRDKTAAREFLGLPSNKFIIGSFQRDTEGADLITPKLEKGPDLFCNYLVKNKSYWKDLHVLLGGWRRQYVQKILDQEKISYTLNEKAQIENVKEMYAACDLYIVSSRYEGGPQAVIEASAMKVPIISTDVGISSKILSKNCIVDIENNFYNPTEEDVDYAYNKVKNLDIVKHGHNFLNIFGDIIE
jgi:glycosyltransferase involved in cell wall biosynthesis